MNADDPTAVLSNPTPPPMPPSKSAFDAMTLEDYFAGQALCGLLAFTTGGPDGCGQMEPKQAARDAYSFAAAMLARRNAPSA